MLNFSGQENLGAMQKKKKKKIGNNFLNRLLEYTAIKVKI